MKKNIGLIALFILLIIAVMIFSAFWEPAQEEAALPDIRLTEILPTNHGASVNEDGRTMGYVTLTNFEDHAVALTGWGLAERAYKVKYVFEKGTTLAPGESLTVWLAGKHGASGGERYAQFSISSHHEGRLYLYAADGRTADEVELPALGENVAYRLENGEWESVMLVEPIVATEGEAQSG